jgi:DNA invertase Pin-like site-specific DNA recombinase
MTKRVLFYARYSTDRQDEQSIETQIELGNAFIASKGWRLVGIYQDEAVSGTILKRRPGIQALLAQLKRGEADILLCVSVDRISRDMEHSTGILKQLRHRDMELWEVQTGKSITDTELGFRSMMSHETIEAIRYRTREGMKTSTRKGKIAGGLSYGYRIKLEYDARGDRIPGLREIDEKQAAIIRWIFEEYAKGKSPSMIAQELNKRGVAGPRGAKWRDTAIRGHVDRGTGILNNEAYRGRVIFNRRNFRKNPDTEKREARMNSAQDWVFGDNANFRIVDDALWERVKRRQREVKDYFEATNTNRLNKTHRPSYLLSGLLRCAECGGPYAISGKDRYSCTNHGKKIPLEQLGDERCGNRRTISRKELEDRVLTCVPNSLWSVYNIDRAVHQVKERLLARERDGHGSIPALEASIESKTREQRSILQQITARVMEGKKPFAAHEQMADELEEEIEKLKVDIAELRTAPKGPSISEQVTPEAIKAVVDAILYLMREHADAETKQPFIQIIRALIQVVEIGVAADGKETELTVYGQIVGILASMDALEAYEAEYKTAVNLEYYRQIDAGVLDTDDKQNKFLRHFDEELAKKRKDLKNLQVSVVAGAGFEPAAFRL